MQGRVGWQEGKGVGVCADLLRTVSREGTASNNRVDDVYQHQQSVAQQKDQKSGHDTHDNTRQRVGGI